MAAMCEWDGHVWTGCGRMNGVVVCELDQV